MIVLEGPAGNGIGMGISRAMEADYAKVEHKLFPDGESYIRIPKFKDDHVVVVQSAYAPQEKHIMELLFIIDALKGLDIDNIDLVIPYLPYVRQNRMFKRNEAVSIETVMRLLNSSGVNSLVTVEPHKKDVMASFKGRYKVVDSEEAFANEFKKMKNPFVVATDAGDVDRADKVADLLGCKSEYIEKKRIGPDEVRITHAPKTSLNGKDVIIVDDVISTGGTVELAAKWASSKGARRVIAAAAHLVMVGDAYERITEAGVSKVYGTNTIPFAKASMVDISPYIAESLKRLW